MCTFQQRYIRFTDSLFNLNSHSYLSLPLIPLEEFLEVYPEHANSDPNELMIARINHEHAEREKLEQARQELLKRKQALIAENKKRKDDLASLDLDLERFIDVSAFTTLPTALHAKYVITPFRLRNPFRNYSRKNICWQTERPMAKRND